MKIIFLQTGGTIDKDYPKKKGAYAFEISDPAVARILDKLDPSFEYEITAILKKDSLDITHEDRLQLKEYCESSDHSHFIITHGTDTMIETAEVLDSIEGKTIVLTGAMRPERFTNSDAPVNLGIAIGAVQSEPSGVYISMHGRIIPWKQCTRDTETGQFIPDVR